MRIRLILFATVAASALGAGPLTFSNTPLLRPNGNSEPEISISSNGTMAMVGLQWLFDPSSFGTNLWTGPFGMTPQFQGVIDASLQQPSKSVFGAGDADVNIGSTGTLHATTLIFLFNPTFKNVKIGVSAIACPGVTNPGFNIAGCKRQIIDTSGADRPWTTSDGPHVYISYHDSGNSSLIHLQRSDDDGLTWQKAGDPIVGQGRTTGNSTFNNDQGNLGVDPLTHNVYDIYATGQAGIQKATSAAFNNIIVSRSTDMGATWTANSVYTAPLFTSLNNVFPSLAVDSATGKLYATWSDGKLVYFSGSSDQGSHWSPAVTINVSPANTALFPWISAHGGIVDIVYYATDTTNTSTAVWNVYLTQTLDGGASFTQSKASNTSNHTGVICTQGVACATGTRNLLDLFEVAINPANGLAGIIYTDDTETVDSAGNPLPQLVLAMQQ
jgi:hypothetical protein